jgi:hypothetical protein
MHFWKSGFLSLHSEETKKKSKVFEILSQLKNLGKFVVHTHKTFLAVCNGLLLPPGISVTEGPTYRLLECTFTARGVHTLRGPSIGCSCHFLSIDV